MSNIHGKIIERSRGVYWSSVCIEVFLGLHNLYKVLRRGLHTLYKDYTIYRISLSEFQSRKTKSPKIQRSENQYTENHRPQKSENHRYRKSESSIAITTNGKGLCFFTLGCIDCYGIRHTIGIGPPGMCIGGQLPTNFARQ